MSVRACVGMVRASVGGMKTLSTNQNVSKSRSIILRAVKHGEQTEAHVFAVGTAAGLHRNSIEQAIGELVDRGIIRSTLTVDAVPSLVAA